MQTTDFSVIGQMYSAVLSQNESKERVDALRPLVEQAVRELKARRAGMRGVGKSLELQYNDSESVKHGFTIAFVS
ncbi:MAG: hypothetical protein IJT12_01875 [Paludibacteraceae bacterium]|nr:hypothetical protein [Paludibacteraceae bacterium]